MAVKRIVVWPDDCLEEISSDVKDGECVKDLVCDLVDTMEAYMGVGLSAPQIGVNKRVIVIDLSKGDEKKNPRTRRRFVL